MHLIQIRLDANVSRAGPDLLHGSHVGVPGRFPNRHQLAVPHFEVKCLLNSHVSSVDTESENEVRLLLPG